MDEGDFFLCYADEGVAYFTDDFEKQWGDDWNDAPYEHNAGLPYTRETRIVRVRYPESFETPREYLRASNTPFSVQDINAGVCAWLFDPLARITIPARTSLANFRKLIPDIIIEEGS